MDDTQFMPSTPWRRQHSEAGSEAQSNGQWPETKPCASTAWVTVACLPVKENLDLFCPYTGSYPGEAIMVALPSNTTTHTPGSPGLWGALHCLCVPQESDWLWHSFPQMHGNGFPLGYTGITSESIRAQSACAYPELEQQSAGSSPRCKELFHLHSKAPPYPCHNVHVEMQTWCGIHV